MKKVLFLNLTFLSLISFAETYKVDPATSSVLWKAGKKIGSFHDGDIKIKSGNLETDAKGNIKSLKIAIDMATIANSDLAGSPDDQKKLIDHLSSDDFFKVKSHPESTFELTSISPKAGTKDEFKIKGNLTMIGNTQPIEFDSKITQEKGKVTGSAKLTIERLKWGLQYGSGSIFKTLTANKIINDSFEMTINLSATK